MRAVDLFAGAGGFTTGALAAGLEVVACANHWRAAIDVHAANHPGVEHVCANLLELDMRRLPRHDVLLASPACQGFSEASQPSRRPKHEADRNTCWAVVCAAEAHRPETILVENVPAIRRWPLFSVWLQAFEALGYVVRQHVFDAADFGVPQNRVRFVLTARRGCALDLRSPALPHRAFGPLVDWHAGEWRRLRNLPVGVRRRAARAKARGLSGRYLLHYSSDHAGREVDRPIGTITTKVQWAAVDGGRSRMLSADELRRGMGFPADYQLPEGKCAAVRMLGNAIPPALAQSICRQAMEAA